MSSAIPLKNIVFKKKFMELVREKNIKSDSYTATSNLVDMTIDDASRIVFGMFDPVEMATLFHLNTILMDNGLINMLSYAVSSKETSDEEGWTLITYKTGRRNAQKTSKKTLLVQARVSRRPKKRFNLKSVVEETSPNVER